MSTIPGRTPAATLDPAADPSAAAPKKSGAMKKLASAAAGVMVGAGLGAAIAVSGLPELEAADKAVLRERLGAWLFPAALAVALGMGWVAIAVHEVGHLLGGVAARFRFWLFVVGPLRVQRDEATGRVRAGLNRELSLYGGVAASLPTDTRDLPRRLAMVIAGGPLASVALALAAWGAAALAGRSPAGVLLSVLALMSAGLAAATLIPMSSGGFTSDGGRLLRLMRSGPVAEREAATLPLIALWSSDTAPREWPRELVEAVTAHRDAKMEECYGNLLAYYHENDRGDTAAAGARMDRVMALIDTFPAAMAPSVYAEAAYFEGFARRDAARARAHLEKVPAKSFVVKPYDRARTEAALTLAEGDPAAARRVAADAIAQVPAKSAWQREWLERIVRAADEAEREAAAAAG
jgi:hypothetical protein